MTLDYQRPSDPFGQVTDPLNPAPSPVLDRPVGMGADYLLSQPSTMKALPAWVGAPTLPTAPVIGPGVHIDPALNAAAVPQQQPTGYQRPAFPESLGFNVFPTSLQSPQGVQADPKTGGFFDLGPVEQVANGSSPLSGPLGLGAPAEAPPADPFGPQSSMSGLATTPITLANFAAYGLEGVPALATALLPNHGQDVPGLGGFLDALGKVGDLAAQAFDIPAKIVRTGNARMRMTELADIASSGSVQFHTGADAGNVVSGTALDYVTGGNNLFSFLAAKFLPALTGQPADPRSTAVGIAQLAAQRGIDPATLAAKLYDLPPDLTAQILADPAAAKARVQAASADPMNAEWNIPLSRTPAVNLGLELGMMAGTMIATAGIGGAIGGAAKAASVTGRLAAISSAGLRGTAALIRVTNVMTTAGWGVRGLEWGTKQLGLLTGDKGVVDWANRMLWEQPLSRNPGWMLISAFGAHPPETLGNLAHGRIDIGRLPRPRGAGARPTDSLWTGRLDRQVTLPDGRVVTQAIDPVGYVGTIDFGRVIEQGYARVAGRPFRMKATTAQTLGAIEQLSLEEIHTKLLSQLGWSLDVTKLRFGDGGEMPKSSLLAFLHHVAMQIVRDDSAARDNLGQHLGLGDTVQERAANFAAQNLEAGTKLLRDEFAGKSQRIAQYIRGRFWERGAVIEDASSLGVEGLLGPYNPYFAQTIAGEWIKTSELVHAAIGRSIIDPASVVALSPAIDQPFIAAFRDHIAKKYATDAPVSANDLNLLKMRQPGIVAHPSASWLGRKSNRLPTVPRETLLKLLDDVAASEKARVGEATALDRRMTQDFFDYTGRDPGVVVGDVGEVARVAHTTSDIVREIRTQEASGNVPAPTEALVKLVHDLTGRSEPELKATPEFVFERASRWLDEAVGRADQATVQRTTFLDFVQHAQSRGIPSEDLGQLTDHVQTIVSAIEHPYNPEVLAHDLQLSRLNDDVVAGIQQVTDELGAFLDDPAHAIRTLDTPAGDSFALPPDAIAADVETVRLVAEVIAGRSDIPLTDEQRSILADPTLNPYMKLGILSDPTMNLPPDAAAAVGRLGSIDAYRPLAETVLGTPPGQGVTGADIAALSKRATDAAAQFASLSAEAAQLRRLIDGDPTGGFRGADLQDTIARLSGAKIPGDWRTTSLQGQMDLYTPVETTWTSSQRGARIRISDAIAEQQALAEQAQRLVQHVEQSAGSNVYDWTVEPVPPGGKSVPSYVSRKLAAARAAEVNATEGVATRVNKVRDGRWQVLRGERRIAEAPGPVAPAVEAALPTAPAEAASFDAAVAAVPLSGDLRSISAIEAEFLKAGGTPEQFLAELARRPDALGVSSTGSKAGKGKLTDYTVPGVDGPVATFREPLLPGAATPAARPTGYVNGDQFEYTGTSQTIHGGLFYDVVMLEGSSKGQAKVVKQPPPGAQAAPPPAVPVAEPIITPPTPERAPAVVYGADRPYPRPGYEKQRIPARMAVIEATDLLNSHDTGFPRDLQPRPREAGDLRLQEQERAIATAPQHDLFMRTESGAEGTPIVGQDGTVIAGNGRTQGMRAWSESQWSAYKQEAANRAADFGLTPDQILNMQHPVLVRVIPDAWMTREHALELNQGTSGMTDAAFAAAIAGSITTEDLAKLNVSETTGLEMALTQPQNNEFATRVLGLLPKADAAKYRNPDQTINASGAALVAGALIGRVIRDPSGIIINELVGSVDDTLGKVRSGIESRLGQLVEAQSLIETGQRTAPSIKGVLGDALAEVMAVRQRGLNVKQSLVEFSAERPGMTHDARLAQQLAGTLLQVNSAKEVRTFLNGYVDAVRNAPDPLNPTLFGGGETVAPLLSDVLNAGVRAVNESRVPEGSLMGAAPDEMLREFPAPDGAVHSTFLTAAGDPKSMIESPPVQNVGTEIASKTTAGVVNVAAHHPQHAAMFAELLADPTAVLDEYNQLHGDQFYSADLSHAELGARAALDSTNPLSAAELLYLRDLSGGLLRWNEAGQFNAPRTPGLGRGGGSFDEINGPLQAVQAQGKTIEVVSLDAAGTLNAGDALHVIDRPQESISPAALQEAIGVPVDHTPTLTTADALLGSAAHVITTDANPDLSNALRSRAGAASPVSNLAGTRVLEFNRPNDTIRLQQLEAQRQAAEARITELQAQQAAVPADRTITDMSGGELLPDPADRAAWAKLMHPGDPKATGSGNYAPATPAQIVDAVESIDRGVLGDLGVTEAEHLRTGLMNLLERVTQQYGGGPTRAERAASLHAAELANHLDKAPFDPAAINDSYALLMDELRSIVISDPTIDPLPGYTGIQYRISRPRTKSRVTGQPLPPRLFFDPNVLRLAEHVAPGLADEILSGRQLTIPERVRRGRLGELYDLAFGSRSEKQIHQDTVQRMTRDILASVADRLTPEQYAAGVRDIARIVRGWRESLQHARIGRFTSRRTIGLIQPSEIEGIARRSLIERHLLGDPLGAPIPMEKFPVWYQEMQRQGGNFTDVWDKHNNRIRSYFANRTGGILEWADQMDAIHPGADRAPYRRPFIGSTERAFVEGVYGHGAVRRLSHARRELTVAYHLLRFPLDIRWYGLEVSEGPTLALSSEGLRATTEGMRAPKPGAAVPPAPTPWQGSTVGPQVPTEPALFGKQLREQTANSWAFWLNADPTLGTAAAGRMRYVWNIVKKRQPENFGIAMREMAVQDPVLGEMMRQWGDNPDQWIARLDQDQRYAFGRHEKLTQESFHQIYDPLLARGSVTPDEYARIGKTMQHVKIPAMEEAIRQSINLDNPALRPLLERLDVINQQIFNDTSQMLFGQPDRSNFQRIMNHPLLFWPFSYQIKATKWLANVLFDHALGKDTGSAGAFTLGQLWAYDQEAKKRDPEYAAWYQAHKTLLFIGQMLLPTTPFDISVGLSPWTREVLHATGLINDKAAGAAPYSRNMMMFGNTYTWTSLLPRLFSEESKAGGLFHGTPLQQFGETSLPPMYAGRPSSSGTTVPIPPGANVTQDPFAPQPGRFP